MLAAVRPLSEELKNIANVELNEIDSRVPQDIETLREWILMQPHLKACTEDQFLLAFLRGSKHSLEKAKSKIDYFYTIKTMMPEMFKNLTFDQKCCDLVSSGAFLWVPKPAQLLGPEIVFTRFNENFDYKHFKLMDILRIRALALEYTLKNVDNSFISGYVEIIDLAKISLSLYAQADLTMIKKLSVFFEKAVPVRLKGIHIINCPKEGRDILQFLKTFLPEKYKKLFYVHKNLKELHKHIAPDFLPKEYGGTNGTITETAKQNIDLLAEFNNYYLENDQYGVNEELRPNKKMDAKSLFGLEGSFRKLEID